MDALLCMSGMLSDTGKLFDLPSNKLRGLWEFMKSPYFKELTVDKQQGIIMVVRETARKVGKLIGEFVGQARKESSSSQNDLAKEDREKIENLIGDLMDEVGDLINTPMVLLLHLEIEMDALLYMSGMLSDTGKLFDLPSNNLRGLWEFMKSPYFKELTVDKQKDIIMVVRETARKVGKLVGEFVGQARKESSSSQNDLAKEDREKIENLIGDLMDKVRDLVDAPMVLLLHLEIEMDALLYMSGMLSDMGKLFDLPSNNLLALREFMKSRYFKDLTVHKQQDIIKIVRETTPKVGKLIGEFVGQARKESSSSQNDLAKEYSEKIKNLIGGLMGNVRDLMDAPRILLDLEMIEKWLNEKDTIIQNNEVKNIEIMLLEEADISNGITTFGSFSTYKKADSSALFKWHNNIHNNIEIMLLEGADSSALFYKKAFPDLFNMQNDHERRMFFFNLEMELGSLMGDISDACRKQPFALLLIGGLLSLKPMANNIWNMVKNDLDKITWPGEMITTDHMGQIFTYCYNDLPYYLQPCFLYFAFYPIGFEIPATSLTQMWIAEEFVEEEDKQTSLESTANKYLDELIQRSLVFVSKRSIVGTIKSCRLPRSIHEFAIQQSSMEGFSVVNPNPKEIESQFRLAIYQDNENQYTEVNHIRSFLAFNCDRIVLGSAMLLKVLALRNSKIPVIALPDMIYLRYLSLRGSNISKLPENIGDMENLQTLDVRDTIIDTLPESLWNIKTLRHVYVKPSPQIKGPPSEKHIDNLHTLKTVVAHESWLKEFPHFLTHLRKLALSNWNNLDWKFISNLLSHMDNLISMAIMGNIIPSEAIDIRAFPNLKTVKSAKLEGEWICRKFPIDNVKFPPNLTKLILTKSGLKEDPMPTLERLQALKFLSLKDEAYTGKQMVCSTNGFPQLQFLELSKLENLEIWVVGWKALLKLSTLRLVHCRKLNQLPNLHFVTINDIDDDDIDDHCWKPNQLPNFHFVINDDDIDDSDDDIDDDDIDD